MKEFSGDFPNQLPVDGLKQVITWAKGGNRDNAGLRSTLVGGWELLGYAIRKGYDFFATPVAPASVVIPEDWVSQLEQLKAGAGAGAGEEAEVVKEPGAGEPKKITLPPWLAPLLLQILQQVITHKA